jgi:hypothetical protein
MGIHSGQLREYIIRPTLKKISLWSKEAEELLLGTAAVESRLGYWIDQTVVGPGPAYGIFQMERPTHDDVVNNFLAVKMPQLSTTILKITGTPAHSHTWLHGNLYYATAMARIMYLRFKDPIPDTLHGQAEYWKQHWNTRLGSGTIDGYLSAYNNYVRS